MWSTFYDNIKCGENETCKILSIYFGNLPF